MITAIPRSPLDADARAYPVLPLRDLVVFPNTRVSLNVGREKSIRAVECAVRGDNIILLATQKRAADEDPTTDTLPHIATLARVIEFTKPQDGVLRILIEGTARAKVAMYTARPDYTEATATMLQDTIGDTSLADMLMRSVMAAFESYEPNKDRSSEAIAAAKQMDDYGRVADTLAAIVALWPRDKQRVLEAISVTDRLALLLTLIETEAAVLLAEHRMRVKASRQMFRIV